MIRFTAHAIDRYIERVKPCLGPSRAQVECMGLALVGKVTTEAPQWLRFEGECDAYLDCGDVAFPLRRNHAVTCLVRGLMSDKFRAERNRRRQARTFARTHKRDVPMVGQTWGWWRP